MGHRSSKQLEEAPSKAIIFQTVHLNNLSILNLKMKIFFALALVIVFPRDVVLDADCDSGDTVPEISDDCLTEFNNMIVNGNMAAFYSRCNAEDAFKNRCSLCCTTECPSGFKNMANDLGGSQEWTEGEGITTCEAACDARSGCTAFEYNHAGEENYKCGTYTGGVSDILTENTGGNSWSTDGYQRSTWTTCYKE